LKPASFEYRRVYDVDEAVGHLAELGDDAKILAGGQSLVAMMNFRLARPAALIDINRVPGLDYLRRDGAALRIGALTTHRTLETTREPAVMDGFAVLGRAARWIGHYPIRARGTFGGSIAHADPAAEWCLLAVLLNAEIVASGPRGQRSIPAERFFESFLSTSLEPDEMITEVVFSRAAPCAAVSEFSRRQGDFAIVAAAASLEMDATGSCCQAAIALAGVDAIPIRVPAAETVLVGVSPGAEAFREAAEIAATEVSPAGDIHASTDFRRHLVRVLLQRALCEAYGDVR